MLILTRYPEERIIISTPSGSMTILVMKIRGAYNDRELANPQVQLGIDAPASFIISREELT